MKQFSEIVNKEIKVALSKHSQPIYFRIFKYVLLAIVIYLLWDTNWLWIVLGALLVFSLSLHFWYRYKTKAWTQSYGMWDFEKFHTSMK